MPRDAIASDLAAGSLVVLTLEDIGPEGFVMPMWMVHPTAAPPGPAGRWLIARLKDA